MFSEDFDTKMNSIPQWAHVRKCIFKRLLTTFFFRSENRVARVCRDFGLRLTDLQAKLTPQNPTIVELHVMNSFDNLTKY